MLTPENGESHENTLVEEAIFGRHLGDIPCCKQRSRPACPKNLPWTVHAAAGALAGPVGQPHTERRPERDAGLLRIKPTHPLSKEHIEGHCPIRCDTVGAGWIDHGIIENGFNSFDQWPASC
jgi:hypothetical protein